MPTKRRRFNTTAAQNIIDTAQNLGTRSIVEPCMVLVQDIKTIPGAFPGRMNTCGRLTVHSSGRFVLVSTAIFSCSRRAWCNATLDSAHPPYLLFALDLGRPAAPG